MTDFDWWGFEETTEQAAKRARAAFEAAEGNRRTLAELLAARGQSQAAAVVALSSMASSRVDDWDGGQFEVQLGVPVALYDRVAGELAEQISIAAEAVIGKGHYAGLEVSIRRPDYRDGWDQELLSALLHGSSTERPTPEVPALPPSP